MISIQKFKKKKNMFITAEVGEDDQEILLEEKYHFVFKDLKSGRKRIYSWQAYQNEKNIITLLTRIKQRNAKNIEIPEYRKLSGKQKESVNMALENPISIITGGAGTGKTKLIQYISDALARDKIPFRLLAFTGKATKPLSDKTQQPASTIHRFIFKEKKEEKEKVRVVILDEMSMVSSSVFEWLLWNCSSLEKLIMVGDSNQLQPISWGPLFEQLINSDAIPVIKLEKTSVW